MCYNMLSHEVSQSNWYLYDVTQACQVQKSNNFIHMIVHTCWKIYCSHLQTLQI